MAKEITISKLNINSINTGIPKGGVTSIFGGSKSISIDKVNIAEPFKSLFPIKEEVLNSIVKSITDSGYDTNQPIIIWQEKDLLVDGHTRLQAAKTVGISSIPAFYTSFRNEEEVLDYMHRLQFNRRNITDADLIRLIINALPMYEKKYGEGSKAEFLTQRFVGLSETKAKRAILIIENAPKELISKVINEEVTINQLYNSLKTYNKKESKKVHVDFFKDDGYRKPIRSDDNGNFYFRNYEKQKEIKAFSLPIFLNSERIRTRIQSVLDEELTGKE